MTERFVLTPLERPSVNGMLLDLEMALSIATASGVCSPERMEVLTSRAALLRRILAAFPITEDE